MVTMENTDEILQVLERFTRLKQKEIPKELEDYLQYVAKTGDTIFKWTTVKYLFREKLLNVIKHFNEDSQRLEEIPNYPNVDPFNYETMKSSLLERLDLFNAAPFTVQRLCELLIDPRKQYSRIDKFMRALEKNILVVSTIDPGRKRTESENGDSLDSVGNGDISLEVNIDIEMENENIFNNVDERNGSGEEVGSGSLKANCSRSDDAPEQPKAKKAKLDYDDSEQRDDDVDEEAIESKPEADQVDAEVTAPDTVDAAEEATEFQKTEEHVTTAKEAPEIEEPDDEEEIKAKVDDAEDKESAEPAFDQTEKADNKAVETAKEATSDSPTQNSSTDEAKEVEGDPDIVEKKQIEGTENNAAKVQKEQKGANATESAEKEDKKETDTEPKSDSDDKSKKTDKESPGKVAEPIDAVAEPAAQKKEDNETVVAESKTKTDSELELNSVADKNKDIVPKTNVEAADKKTDAPTKAAGQEKETSIKSAEDKAPEEPETAAVPAAVPIETDEQANESATPLSPVAVDTPAAVTSPPSADAAVFSGSTTPSLALNDQPMEDTPAEEEDAQVSPSTAVEEVVMAESSAAAGDMATDEVTKDEPAAMEVDDTSQEVMDQ